VPKVDFGLDLCFSCASKRLEMSGSGTVFLGDSIEASEVDAKVEASHLFLNERTEPHGRSERDG